MITNVICIFCAAPLEIRLFIYWALQNHKLLSDTWDVPVFTLKSYYQTGKEKLGREFSCLLGSSFTTTYLYGLGWKCGNFDFPLSHSIYHQLTLVKWKGNSTYSIPNKKGWWMCNCILLKKYKKKVFPFIMPFIRSPDLKSIEIEQKKRSYCKSSLWGKNSPEDRPNTAKYIC